MAPYQPKILFVSAFITIYPDRHYDIRTNEWRIQHFETLLKTGIDILLFITNDLEQYISPLVDKYKNLKFKTIELQRDLRLFKQIANAKDLYTLPEHRNQEKDTLEYMALMNSKMELMYYALTEISAPYYAWIDFSIPYIFKNPQNTLSFIKELPKCHLAKSFLYIPGCWDVPESQNLIINAINWHFCGGFFLGDKCSILDFFLASTKHQAILTTPPYRMVWETNYWAYLVSNGYWIPSHWQRVGDHDDTMLTKMPSEIIYERLEWDTVEDIIVPAPESWGYPSNITMTTIAQNTYYIGRLINYKLNENGYYYIYRDDNQKIENINVVFGTDISPFALDTSGFTQAPEGIHTYSSGLEDIRLYSDFTFSAGSSGHIENGALQIVFGKIDIHTGKIEEMKHIKSPNGEYQMEKNWIWLPSGSVIYNWHPYQLGHVDNETSKLIIDRTHNLTPCHLFQKMRGSTPFIPYRENVLVGVVHFSTDISHDAPSVRIYNHCLILLDATTELPISVSLPFIFGRRHCIEFCIGMEYDLDNNRFTLLATIMDRDPKKYIIKEDKIEWFPVSAQ